MFVVLSHRLSKKRIEEMYPDATIIDVTSRGPDPWIRFSPFYPHGNIPVPFSPGWESASVEGIWQGLKVFEQAGIDLNKLKVTTMKGLKRSIRTYGKVLGHQKGVEGVQLLSYVEARRLLYLPSYFWVLENCLQPLLRELKEIEKETTVLFLDYETNIRVEDVSRPLSHAGLIKLYLEGNWSNLAQ